MVASSTAAAAAAAVVAVDTVAAGTDGQLVAHRTVDVLFLNSTGLGRPCLCPLGPIQAAFAVHTLVSVAPVPTLVAIDEGNPHSPMPQTATLPPT